MKGSPTKILMTVDAVGGVWTYAMELCQNLPATKFLLACMGPPPSDAQRREAAGLPNVELTDAPYRLEWMAEPWEEVEKAGAWLLDLAASFGADVIHLNGYAQGALPWKRPLLVVAHSCVLSWWKAVKGEAPPPSWSRYADAVNRGLEAADAVIAPSHAMGGFLRQNYHLSREIDVIYNGRRVRRLQGPSAKEPMILCVGRLWDEAKNAMMLAKIADHLPWPVVMAGDEVSPDGSTPDLANVNLTGRLAPANLESYYDRAMIFALPARYEPFGLSALEAALAGCALVLGDIPTFREIWGDAALYVSTDDPQMILRVLQQLIASPAEIQRLGARAKNRALLYSTSRMAQAYERTYSELIRGAKSRTPQLLLT